MEEIQNINKNLPKNLPASEQATVDAVTEALKAAGFNAKGYVSPGTGHEFQTWRRSLLEMAPMLFK